MLHESFPIISKNTHNCCHNSTFAQVYTSKYWLRERIAKWGIVLEASDIKYMAHTSVKGLVLTALIAQFAEFPLEKEAENQGMDKKSVGIISLQKLMFWNEYIDIF